MEQDTGIVKGDSAIKELYGSAYTEGSFLSRLQEEVGAMMNESLSLNNLVTTLRRENEEAVALLREIKCTEALRDNEEGLDSKVFFFLAKRKEG